jgi:hypothetical protein
MRPQFGGRRLLPGFEVPVTAEAMPLFALAVEAECEALAAIPTDQLMRNRGPTHREVERESDMSSLAQPNGHEADKRRDELSK